jgi:hypothetical protein
MAGAQQAVDTGGITPGRDPAANLGRDRKRAGHHDSHAGKTCYHLADHDRSSPGRFLILKSSGLVAGVRPGIASHGLHGDMLVCRFSSAYQNGESQS